MISLDQLITDVYFVDHLLEINAKKTIYVSVKLGVIETPQWGWCGQAEQSVEHV